MIAGISQLLNEAKDFEWVKFEQVGLLSHFSTFYGYQLTFGMSIEHISDTLMGQKYSYL